MTSPKTWITAQFETVNIFNLTPTILKRRLTAKVQRSEIIALSFSLISLFGLVLMQNAGNFITYYDLSNFLNAGQGNFEHYYYAYWAVPFFSFLSILNHPYHFLLIGIINIFATWFAVRVFGAKLIPILVSIHMLYILSQGQIIGIIVGGFALFVAGLVTRRWTLAGLGMVIALSKFQMGIIPTLTLLFFWGALWKEKIKILLIPLIISILSLFIYPWWPLQLLQTIRDAPPFADGSISLWSIIGAWSLILWIPPLILKTSKENRFYLFLLANMLAIPYFQQTDLLLLFVLLSGYGAVLANVPFFITTANLFPQIAPWVIIRSLVFIPLVVYFLILKRAITSEKDGK